VRPTGASGGDDTVGCVAVFGSVEGVEGRRRTTKHVVLPEVICPGTTQSEV